ncbi:MAG: molybdopterin-synthase adenylyltransferase MoeB [Rhodospirillales bacterium]|jgi:adenylyltransferase/sulfurtransferase|nr:molybdopterin-synthase adenylyltransferase MoeB [Rhodospirillales bacterium]MDP6882834.1 molybdopterin-synthase adenylyltransferase MoeB [Rhodospirillales bacterium]
MDFSQDQVQRYARHILLREVGGEGQARLLRSKVLVVGAGGLGSPLILYLAAAGVGTIGVVDPDVVDLSNLQRQIVHHTASIGRPKVESARETAAAVNPEVTVVAHNEAITADNALGLISGYDLVADGTDNFPTRFLVNDACYLAEKPLVSAAILRFDGQIYTFRPFEDGADRPCYRCIFPEAPPPGQVPTCAEAGVLGALCGMVGSLQATEVLKELLGIGESLAGAMIICDALSATFRKIKVKRDPACALCGAQATIKDLSHHAL